MGRPLVIVGDVHLGHRPSEAIALDLARLVDAHPGREVVLNGDTFNLSWDPPAADPAASVAAMLVPHPRLCRALGAHAGRGDAVTVLAGNHDADVQRPDVASAIRETIGCRADAPIAIEPWFIRRGRVHVEHGHVYDPDNAPAHPLAPPSFRSEPTGVALVRRFLARHRDVAMLDRQEATPLENLRDAVATMGLGAPRFLAGYGRVLVGINLDAARRGRLRHELESGNRAIDEQARRSGLPAATVRALLARRPVPTHTRAGLTFMRLYFDRIAAAAAIAGGAVVAGVSSPPAGAGLAGTGVVYLVASSRRGRNRYANRMADSLVAGAKLVRDLTGAELVCFGHTHEEAEAGGYLNSGAFGDRSSRGRPFIHVDESGRAERRRLPPG